MPLKKIIKENDIENFKRYEKSIVNKSHLFEELISDVMKYDAYGILEYMIKNYYSSDIKLKQYMERCTYYITKPIDDTSFDNAKYLATKSILDEAGIKYTVK